MQALRNPALCPERIQLSWPPSAQSPFARNGCYPRRGGLKAAWRGVTPSSSLIRAHAPDHHPPRASGLPVVRAVFAGSRQSLLGDGPSRHYLCDPCVGARTHTPPRSSAARVRFFTEDTGLTPRQTGSTRESTPTQQLRWGPPFRGCSHSFIFGLLRSLGPQVAPTATAKLPGGRAFHTTHRPAGYPDRDVASLHARHGQLAWLDFHQLDHSLVGCSLPLGGLPLATEGTAAVSGHAFTRSIEAPRSRSCCLYAGRRLGSKRVSPRLIPGHGHGPGFDVVYPFRRVNGRGPFRPIAHLPSPHLPRSSRDFSHDVHHNGLQPMQLWVV